ncbi:MAG: methyltransferase domain-containing protein [Opitutales bacterium]|nr:methyltransferase domain-containing protein [Opitutales bacterium]MCH8539236.1 methyltransferase domain-containing protein [Opitutales bacterium]
MTAPDYESREAVDQYLLFHYGSDEANLPWSFGPSGALRYPVRVVEALLDSSILPSGGKALDIGCAVGASSFALAHRGLEVTGFDLSAALIKAANQITQGEIRDISIPRSGTLEETVSLIPPEKPVSGKVAFLVGDAMNPPTPAEPGNDVVLLANLIDRVPDPWKCLQEAIKRLRPGGQLLLASPYTWLESCAPPEKWLVRDKEPPLEVLQRTIGKELKLAFRTDIPFLIREHERKFQWSVAEGTRWIKSG